MDPNLGIDLRPANADDARNLWNWRNDSVARSMSGNTDPVPWESHIVWFERRLSDDNAVTLIGLHQDESIGVVRFDRRDDLAEVSIVVAPDFRGRGLGKALLRCACEFAQQTGFSTVFEARIRISNGRSQRIFERVGFVAVGRIEEQIYYRWIPSRETAADRGTILRDMYR